MMEHVLHSLSRVTEEAHIVIRSHSFHSDTVTPTHFLIEGKIYSFSLSRPCQPVSASLPSPSLSLATSPVKKEPITSVWQPFRVNQSPVLWLFCFVLTCGLSVIYFTLYPSLPLYPEKCLAIWQNGPYQKR